MNFEGRGELVPIASNNNEDLEHEELINELLAEADSVEEKGVSRKAASTLVSAWKKILKLDPDITTRNYNYKAVQVAIVAEKIDPHVVRGDWTPLDPAISMPQLRDALRDAAAIVRLIHELPAPTGTKLEKQPRQRRKKDTFPEVEEVIHLPDQSEAITTSSGESQVKRPKTVWSESPKDERPRNYDEDGFSRLSKNYKSRRFEPSPTDSSKSDGHDEESGSADRSTADEENITLQDNTISSPPNEEINNEKNSFDWHHWLKHEFYLALKKRIRIDHADDDIRSFLDDVEKLLLLNDEPARKNLKEKREAIEKIEMPSKQKKNESDEKFQARKENSW